ncbi:MAG: response regulator transcription factor, partial [Treponemataceae bacterium]|nr:response regulator transcription factor [Treponemataceae bacterium]
MRKDVFLFDDHALTREGMAMLLAQNSDWNVAGQAGSVREAFSVIDAAEPAQGDDCLVALVDLSFAQDDDNGFSIIRHATASGKGIRCIVLSTYDSAATVGSVMNDSVGAAGFVSKIADFSVVLEALETVAAGGTYIQKNLVPSKLETYEKVCAALTKKERQIVECLVLGYDNGQIAKMFFISERTVSNHLGSIYD